MPIADYQHNPSAVHQDYQRLNDGSIITQKGCQIYIPQNYVDRHLAKIGVETYILGIHGIVVGGKDYGTSMAPAMMKVDPDDMDNETYKGMTYLVLSFEPGSTVIVSDDIVQDQQLIYPIYNEFIAKGYIPWYFDYYKLGQLFAWAKQYSGVSLGGNHAIMEVIAATICRDPANPKDQFRHILTEPGDWQTKPFKIVPMENVAFGASNTTTKLIGSYFSDGLNSALTERSEQVEPIEDLIRR